MSKFLSHANDVWEDFIFVDVQVRIPLILKRVKPCKQFVRQVVLKLKRLIILHDHFDFWLKNFCPFVHNYMAWLLLLLLLLLLLIGCQRREKSRSGRHMPDRFIIWARFISGSGILPILYIILSLDDFPESELPLLFRENGISVHSGHLAPDVSAFLTTPTILDRHFAFSGIFAFVKRKPSLLVSSAPERSAAQADNCSVIADMNLDQSNRY